MANYYLELDSTFRDRESWPLPGEFQAILSSERGIAQTMVDPVCKSEPVSSWTSNLFNVNVLGSDAVAGQIETINIGNAGSKKIIEFSTINPDILQERYNYYKNAVVRNVTQPQNFSRIYEYVYLGNNRGQLSVCENFEYNFGDNINIVDPSDFTDSSNAFLFVPNGSIFDQNYLGKFIYNETLSDFRTIVNYDNQTGLIKIGPPSIMTWTTQDNYSIRESLPNFTSIIGPLSTTNQIVITGTAASTVNNYYIAWYIRIPNSIYDNTTIKAESRRVVNYDGVTKTAIVNPPFSFSPSNFNCELMQYSYDNASPLYWRSTISQEVPLYSIKLKRLILPNHILAVGSGGKPAYQPYFYVELSSGEPTSQIYNIYSNNPNSFHSTFRASVMHIENLNKLQFIVLKGDGMKQIIRFKLDSSIKMRIVIPSTGQTFQTVIPDTISPEVPNPAVQINALFEFSPYSQ